MRHRVLGGKFNRDKSARKALFRSLATSLIKHNQITTTVEKAKAIRPIVEKLITKAKVGNQDLSTRRNLLSFLYEAEAVEKAFELGSKYNQRPGGYLRIIKNGIRKGDGAPIAIIQFV
jgi:large subunit ribosomal protein L17